MTKCTKCKLDYPDNLVSDLVSSFKGQLTHTRLCAVCGLLASNATMGLPLDTPFEGTIAKQMYKEAVKYKAKHYDKN